MFEGKFATEGALITYSTSGRIGNTLFQDVSGNMTCKEQDDIVWGNLDRMVTNMAESMTNL